MGGLLTSKFEEIKSEKVLSAQMAQIDTYY
jgi:hypothetical protein